MKALRLAALLLYAGAAGRTSAAPSIARVWDEEILAAIRIDTPHPPVHARNLFGLSVAMYDAWTAYDPVAVGYVIAANTLPLTWRPPGAKPSAMPPIASSRSGTPTRATLPTRSPRWTPV